MRMPCDHLVALAFALAVLAAPLPFAVIWIALANDRVRRWDSE